MKHIYLGLGANVGNKEANIRKALTLLTEHISNIEIASFYFTKPVGFADQDNFLNTAVKGFTKLSPKKLLQFIKTIEVKIGRIKRFKNGPREIDIDILFYDDLIYKDEKLEIPHPRLSERDFVLQPLSDIDPDFIHPFLKKKVKELLQAIPKGTRSIISSISDEFFLNETLKLAKKGISWTNPHPMVGAVIVKGNKIIAQGYHHRFGSDHAEMDALKHATENVEGATMYVSLEPCHLSYDLSGPRKPCVDIIKQVGIRKVHIAMLDSNPEVSGKGRMMLKKVGISTTLGCMGQKALQLNETYHHFMTKGRPFVAITFSVSLDGKIATRTGDSKWITNEQARTYARKLRNHYQAILVGISTVLKDDPHLGTRIKGKKDPIRIILDSTLKIPLTSQVLRDTNVLIATTTKANKEKLKILTDRGIPVVVFNNNSIPLPGLLEEFKKRKIISVLVEGGGQILGSFVDTKLVDKVYAFHAPILIGGEKGVSAIQGRGYPTIKDALKLEQVSVKRFDDNVLTVGNIK